jgi:uncharacterized BrkB/YihY/UPF0761 family membrane protein
LRFFRRLLFAVSLAGVLPVQNSIDRGVRLISRIAPGDVLSIAREQLVAVAEEPHLFLVLASFARHGDALVVLSVGTGYPDGRSFRHGP